MTNKITILSRMLLILSSALLVVSVYVPIWQIDLDAPQYPEGLNLKIFADSLGGDVDIINGLNHYIGMKTLHAKDFIEFSILTYIILAYALFALVAGVLGKKKVLNALFILFVLFGIIAMVDFWRWEYNYGHDLDPKAAIIVPGMAYQPPLIGFKQLLNFGAYSIPDTGGWLFITSGFLMLIAMITESKFMHKFLTRKNISFTVTGLLVVFISSCSAKGPDPIKLNIDNCDNCKMTLSDARFACELITSKQRVYKFDDLACMMSFKKEHADKALDAQYFVADYLNPHQLFSAENAIFIKGDNVGSPMGGNMAAFANKDSAGVYKQQLSAEEVNWQGITQ